MDLGEALYQPGADGVPVTRTLGGVRREVPGVEWPRR